MFVKIELLAGPNKRTPTKLDMDKNIEAMDRAIKGKKLFGDDVLLVDTRSILYGIRERLPGNG